MTTLSNVPNGSGKTKIELPWLDYATTEMPDNHVLIMWWAQYLWMSDGNFRSAFQRVADHFITAIQFPELSADEESEYKTLFNKHLNYRRELKACADDFLAYGNLFVTLYLPIKRMLACKKCGLELAIARAPYKLDLSGAVTFSRTMKCPACGDTHPYRCKDYRDPNISKLRLKRFSPFDIEVAMNAFSMKKNIYWKIPPADKQDYLSGAPIHIEETPMVVLEAVASGGMVKIDAESVFHLDETAISGIQTRGWGIPRSVSNFRSAWLMQVINRADQAIASDYTLGMRILSPGMPPGGAVDPMQNQGMSEFVNRTKRMIDEHRANPASYHTAPYPMNYQFAGGEGAELLPADKLKFRHQEFLNQCGIPLDYHQMTLTTQAAPMALQLFENSWQSIPAMYNSILAWIVEVTSRNFGLEVTEVVMQKSTIAYDEARKQLLAQLMSANQISPSTALEPFGVDAIREVDRVFKHQDYVAKKQQEHDEEAAKEQEMGAVSALAGAPTPSMLAQQAQQGAGAPPGGAPAGAGAPPGGDSSTLQGMSDQAEVMASQLVSMPEYDRKAQLRAIRENNKDLHALVTSAMERIRSQAASQGQQQILAQAPAGGAPPAG
jgi:hypothetical protein